MNTTRFYVYISNAYGLILWNATWFHGVVTCSSLQTSTPSCYKAASREKGSVAGSCVVFVVSSAHAIVMTRLTAFTSFEINLGRRD
jgi:hypothetical protein